MLSAASRSFTFEMRRPHEPTSSFTTTRTRESRTPTVGVLFTPVLFFLRSQGQGDRGRLRHLELGTAVRAGNDLTLDGIGADGHVGIAFRTLRHGSPSLAASGSATPVSRVGFEP